jgi:hypothetical protein
VRKVSAFVTTAGLRDPLILQATLHAASFVDELILVDKGQKALSSEIIERCPPLTYCREPWSPTVERTRAAADAMCSHEWRICLDDDEILSPAAAGFVREAVEIEDAAIYQIPIRHHILGRWDAALRHEWRPALYRKGAIRYGATTHGGRDLLRDQHQLPHDDPVYIDHLSHATVNEWLEKAARYTSQRNRVGAPVNASLVEHARYRFGLQTDPIVGDPYREAIGLLMAVYDIVDAVKRWEETQPDGNAEFRRIAETVLAR